MNILYFTINIFYKAFPIDAWNIFFLKKKKTLKIILGLSEQKASII